MAGVRDCKEEEGVSRSKAFLALISVAVAGGVLLSGCAEDIARTLNPRAGIPGSLLFISYNVDTFCYELRKHNIASGSTEILGALPEWDSYDKEILFSAFDYSEKHKALIVDWSWRYRYPNPTDTGSNHNHTIKMYVRDETGRYVEGKTLFEDPDLRLSDSRYFCYAEQIDRLCVGIDGGVDFVNLETGETEDRLQLREDGKDIKWLDWNSDCTLLAYTVLLQLPVYLYDARTGASRELPWEPDEPQFAGNDRDLVGHYPGAVSCYTLNTGEKKGWQIKSIDNIEVSPDQKYAAVTSRKDVGLFGTDVYRVDIVDLSTGSTMARLLEDEISGFGSILWIDDDGSARKRRKE
jgi:hypothetical protein